MAFSSSLPGGRISPPRIRGSRHWPSGSIIRRDKASCIGFLSLVVIVYAGMSLGLVFWNQSAVEESQAVVRPAEARTGASRLQNNAPFGVLPSSPVRDIHDVHGGKSPKGTEATAFGKGIGAGQAGLDKGEESLRGAGGREGDNEATDRAVSASFGCLFVEWCSRTSFLTGSKTSIVALDSTLHDGSAMLYHFK